MTNKQEYNPRLYSTPVTAFAIIAVALIVRVFFFKTGKPYVVVEYTTYFDVISLLTSILIDIAIRGNKKWWSFISSNSKWLKISICYVVLTFWHIVRQLFIPALGRQLSLPKTYFILLCLPFAIYGIVDFAKRQHARRVSTQ